MYIEILTIYSSEYCSNIRQNEALTNTRNLILVELYKNPDGIFQQDISKDVAVPSGEIKELLVSLCEKRDITPVEDVIDVKNITRRRLWSLKVQRETTFAKRFVHKYLHYFKK